jgi:hypothetical protein
MKHRCAHPDCAEPGRLRVENDNWLCLHHVSERLDRPDIRAANQADEDLEEFLDNGGKLS